MACRSVRFRTMHRRSVLLLLVISAYADLLVVQGWGAFIKIKQHSTSSKAEQPVPPRPASWVRSQVVALHARHERLVSQAEVALPGAQGGG